MSESVHEGSAKKKSSAESRDAPEKEKQESTAQVDDKESRDKDKREEKETKEKPVYVEKDVVEDEGLYKSLQLMPFYHGFLPREDLQAVLVNEGDYLIRVSEVTTKKKEGTAIKRDIILSLCAADYGPPGEEKDPKSDANAGERKMRNLVIRRYDGKFSLKNGQFPTIEALLENYNVNNTNETKKNRMLKTAVPLENWEIRHSSVKLGDKLGEGAYGEVRKGVLQRKGKNLDVAVKLMKGSGDMNKIKIREMMKEARLMRNFKHRNVVRFFGVAVLEQPLYIILELVNGGALNTYLQKNKNVSTLELLTMCLGAAQGLQYLHANQCIHRDIAARNCLYSVDKVVKLSDFGLSLIGTAYKLCSSQKLPIKWLAPETITTLFFTPKTDVYSYGVMCYEIYAEGEEPWDGTSNTEAKKNVVQGKHLQMPEACPEKFRSFIHEKIFVVDPKRRVVMDDVVRFIEPIINDMHNATATFVIEKSELVNPAPRPSAIEASAFSPRAAFPSARSNNTTSSKKSKSKVMRKKAEKTKKDKKKKTAHPGNHNMVEK